MPNAECSHGGKNKNDRIDSEKLTHLLRSNLIPPAYVYPAEKRPLRALLRQRIFYVWSRAELLARIHSHQLAHHRTLAKRTCSTRDPWEAALLAAEPEPLRRLALQNDMAMIRHYDHQLTQLGEELKRLTHRDGVPARQTLEEKEKSPFGRFLPIDRAGLIGVRHLGDHGCLWTGS